MAKFAVIGSGTVGTNKTVVSIAQPASSLKGRAKVFYAAWSSAATADNSVDMILARLTTVGTSTAVTPLPFDPADSAAILLGGSNHSAEPTYTAGGTLLTIGGHQRAGNAWYAPPGGELIIPATASNGIGMKSNSASATFVAQGTIHYEE